MNFRVKPLRQGSLAGSSPQVTLSFRKELEEFERSLGALMVTLNETTKTVEMMEVSLWRNPFKPGELKKKSRSESRPGKNKYQPDREQFKK